MVKHIVMWKLKDRAEGNDKEGNRKLIISKLLALESIIEELETIEMGENFNPTEAAYDLVLISTHKSKEALAAYAAHPAHVEAASFVGKIVADRKVVDFEF